MKNAQLETFEEQLDPPIVSNKSPWAALGCPPGRGASTMRMPTPGSRPRAGQEVGQVHTATAGLGWASPTSVPRPGHVVADGPGHLPWPCPP